MHDSAPPAPQFVAPPPDPALEILQKQTENQNIDAMREAATRDTAHLMQQYGIMTALGAAPALGSTSSVSVSPTSIAGPAMMQSLNSLFNKAA